MKRGGGALTELRFENEEGDVPFRQFNWMIFEA
jgi:hypothetical protein